MKSESREKAISKAFGSFLRAAGIGDKDVEPNDKGIFIAGFDAGVAHATQWVRISESGLPEEDGKYLVTWKAHDCGPFTYIAEFFAENGEDEAAWHLPEIRNDAEVTAYMPLPPPCEIDGGEK